MTLPAVYPSEQGLVFGNPAVQRPILAEGVRSQRPSGVHSPYPSSHLIVKSFFSKQLVDTHSQVVKLISCLRPAFYKMGWKRTK